MKTTGILRLCGGGGAIGRSTPLLLMLLRTAKRKRSGASTSVARARTAPTATAKRRTPRQLHASAKRGKEAAHTFTTDVAPLSLADFHPAIARTWIAAASSKMLQPQHVSPGSRKLAWWICPSCQHQYNKRIDLHLAAGGACPKCNAKPSLNPPTAARQGRQGRSGTSAAKATQDASSASAGEPTANAVAVIAHRCRPQSSNSTLAAENANMLSKSVADDQYLRVQERRNLLPMLAKNFENEKAKIGEAEVVRVSPKLDGIRCVVAYRADTKQVLFFSRSGTLFECCDDLIEPAVRHLFEADPTLVLDGELYNDSANLAQLAVLQKKSIASRSSSASSSLSSLSNNRPSSNPTAAFYAQLLASVRAAGNGGTGAKKSGRGGKGTSASTSLGSAKEPVVIRFEQLTSAIRTTRQRITPAVAAMQRQLQYHVFDVLYAREFPDGAAATVPFSVRYAFLKTLLAEATQYNMSHIKDYNPLVLRLVPNFACTLDQVDEVLRAAMRVGYEGVMIRRERKGKCANALLPARTKLKRAVSRSSGDGGYGYGQRSGTLLKYKVMQDAEYVIVGALEGSGKWKGSLGSFICVTSDAQQRFTVTPASTDAERKRMWRTWKQAYQGKALTVQYQELTPDGVPRFPVGKSVRGAADGHDWL